MAEPEKPLPEPRSISILAGLIYLWAVGITVTVLFFGNPIDFHIGSLRITTMDLMALTIPLVGVTLVYEIIRLVLGARARRQQEKVADTALLNRIARRSRDAGRAGERDASGESG